MKIPVAIVDDEEADRYLAKRYLSKTDNIELVAEYVSGDNLLDEYFSQQSPPYTPRQPLLVLMDVNMPGRDGFDTAKEIQRIQTETQTSQGIVIMMYTSSNNPYDHAKGAAIELIKGHILKPISADDIDNICQVYMKELDL